MTVAARITCETLPGLLRDFRTASDKSCGRGLGTRLGLVSLCLKGPSCYVSSLYSCAGDHFYKENQSLPLEEQMITAMPDVRMRAITEDDEFFVVACDGIWYIINEQILYDYKCSHRLLTLTAVVPCLKVHHTFLKFQAGGRDPSAPPPPPPPPPPMKTCCCNSFVLVTCW